MTAGMLGLFNVQLFLTKNVSQLISGYEDPLLNLGKIADPSKVKSSKFSLLNDVLNLITILKKIKYLFIIVNL